jgi:hypothetical protein
VDKIGSSGGRFVERLQKAVKSHLHLIVSKRFPAFFACFAFIIISKNYLVYQYNIWGDSGNVFPYVVDYPSFLPM